MLRGQRQVRCPHALEKRPLLALEVIRLAGTDPARAHVERRIEQQRQIGLKSFLYFGSQCIEQSAADSSAAALVGDSGVGEPIADDPTTRVQRGADHFVEMPSARSEHQERLDLGRQRSVIAVQDPVAHALTELRAAGLARRDDVIAGPAYGVGRECDVRRLADAFDAFERNERAAHHCRERNWRK
jgi:hypothetical protein